MLVSDRIRMDHIKRPDETLDHEIKETKILPKKYADLDKDLVYVIETPKYIYYYEWWNDTCKYAFEKKYKHFSKELVELKMKNRIREVEKELGIKLLEYDYTPLSYEDDLYFDDLVFFGISFAKFSK